MAGLFQNGKRIYIPEFVDVSYADYQALTHERKNCGALFFVQDYPVENRTKPVIIRKEVVYGL